MPEARVRPAEDIVIVERRSEPRIIVSVPARYVLTNRRDATGNRREFACRIVNLSCTAMAVMVPVLGSLGERVIVHCDEFGRLEGTIMRLIDRAFVLRLTVNAEERAKLAARIEGYEKIKHHDQTENRNHKRVQPKNPYAKLVFHDGRVSACFVIDISASGAAVSADVRPDIGTPLALGAMVGRVVRHFDNGFAIQFIAPRNLDEIETALTAV